jgi:hypothetical protein
MRRPSRRQVLRSGVFLAGFSLLCGREADAQQSAKVSRIGFLAVGSREGRAFMIKGFLQGLRDHGYLALKVQLIVAAAPLRMHLDWQWLTGDQSKGTSEWVLEPS